MLERCCSHKPGSCGLLVTLNRMSLYLLKASVVAQDMVVKAQSEFLACPQEKPFPKSLLQLKTELSSSYQNCLLQDRMKNMPKV